MEIDGEKKIVSISFHPIVVERLPLSFSAMLTCLFSAFSKLLPALKIYHTASSSQFLFVLLCPQISLPFFEYYQLRRRIKISWILWHNHIQMKWCRSCTEFNEYFHFDTLCFSSWRVKASYVNTAQEIEANMWDLGQKFIAFFCFWMLLHI